MGAPTDNMKSVAYLALAAILFITGKLEKANWGRYIFWLATFLVIIIVSSLIFNLENERLGVKNANPIQNLYNWVIGNTQAKVEKASGKKDWELHNSGFHKKFFPNGTTSAKYIRLPSPGRPFKMYLSKGNKHFKLQTRSGRDISIEQMRREAKKKGRFLSILFVMWGMKPICHLL